MSQGNAINAPEIRALVEEASPPLVPGQVAPITMTTDGRLRVVAQEMGAGVAFFSKNQKDVWGDLQADITFSGSPWSAW